MARERPIIFSTPMVNAILTGAKTQTRRLIFIQPDKHGRWPNGHQVGTEPRDCEYGEPGDRLWVRETFRKRYADAERDPADGIQYRADGGFICEPPWTPAIFMPRWASRLTLKVWSTRPQRLNDISPADAVAEGVTPDSNTSHRGAFAKLWDSINKKRGTWATNPWVWVIEFRPIRGVTRG